MTADSGLLDQYAPATDRRCALPHALALGVLLRSIAVEREPIYRNSERVRAYAASLFGLEDPQLRQLSDNRLGRALDRLYDADRAALLTAMVLAVGRSFGVRFDELHMTRPRSASVGNIASNRI